MFSRLKAFWRLPRTVVDGHTQSRMTLDEVIQSVRDLEATIKTHWAVDPAAERPAKPRSEAKDPHGL